MTDEELRAAVRADEGLQTAVARLLEIIESSDGLVTAVELAMVGGDEDEIAAALGVRPEELAALAAVVRDRAERIDRDHPGALADRYGAG